MFTMIPYRPNMINRSQYSFDNDFFRPFFSRSENGAFRVDVKDNGDSYSLEADLPGISKDMIHIDVDDNNLTITVERNEDTEEKRDKGYLIRERSFGRASRSFIIDGIRKDDITAAYQDGVLRLTLPKEQKQNRRTINIA